MEDPTVVPEAVLVAYGLENARIELLTGGRTNRTLRVRAGRDLVLQQMMSESHADLLGIMENLVRVTSHLDWHRKVDRQGDSWYPQLMPTIAGKTFTATDNGDVWRAFSYREGRIVRSSQTITTLASAAAMYGRFCAATADLGGPPLLEIAPGFHDIELVHAGFLGDLEAAPPDRRSLIDPHLDRLQRLKTQLDQRCRDDGLDDLEPRVVHNDTKLSNILFDHNTGEASAVLDLDLAMMGPAWHDFGDLMRSACWHAPATPVADVTDPDSPVVNVRAPSLSPELFTAIAHAYAAGAGETLTPAEISTFAVAGPRLSLELGFRYLNDHLRDVPHLRVDGENGHLKRGLANVMLAEEMLRAYDALRLSADEISETRCVVDG